ncbi:hypothetical protein UACE39S_01587 [Ureibacillus acetophenoni]
MTYKSSALIAPMTASRWYSFKLLWNSISTSFFLSIILGLSSKRIFSRFAFAAKPSFSLSKPFNRRFSWDFVEALLKVIISEVKSNSLFFANLETIGLKVISTCRFPRLTFETSPISFLNPFT